MYFNKQVCKASPLNFSIWAWPTDDIGKDIVYSLRALADARRPIDHFFQSDYAY